MASGCIKTVRHVTYNSEAELGISQDIPCATPNKDSRNPLMLRIYHRGPWNPKLHPKPRIKSNRSSLLSEKPQTRSKG